MGHKAQEDDVIHKNRYCYANFWSYFPLISNCISDILILLTTKRGRHLFFRQITILVYKDI